MNDTLKIINNRMSLRKYAKKDIDDKELDIIIQSALRAPTAGNMMLYSIIKIRDEETKKILSKTCDNQPFIATAPVVLIFVADLQRLYDYFELCNVREYCEKHNKVYEKPGKAELMLACCDAVIAAENAVIAAESLGIGSCYIGDIMENFQIHKDLLNLCDYTFPICMLTLGYYEENAKRIISPRYDKKYIVFDEKYKRLNEDEFKSMYSAQEKSVNPNNVYDAENFAQMTYARKMGSDFMKEMERSVNEYMKFWKK